MENNQGIASLVADLTWAELYAGQIRGDLKTLTPTVKKISMSAELTKGAARLREQLKAAHRTMSVLRTMAGSDPRRSN